MIEKLTRLARGLPRCAECGRDWLNPRERWQTHLTDDDQVAFFCPACSRVEFGDGGEGA